MECNNFIQQRFELVLTKYLNFSLREKYPNTEFFLVRIFQYLDWIQTSKNYPFGDFLWRFLP